MIGRKLENLIYNIISTSQTKPNYIICNKETLKLLTSPDIELINKYGDPHLQIDIVGPHQTIMTFMENPLLKDGEFSVGTLYKNS